MLEPAPRTRHNDTLPKLPSPIVSFRTSNLSSRAPPELAAAADPRNVIATVISLCLVRGTLFSLYGPQSRKWLSTIWPDVFTTNLTTSLLVSSCLELWWKSSYSPLHSDKHVWSDVLRSWEAMCFKLCLCSIWQFVANHTTWIFPLSVFNQFSPYSNDSAGLTGGIWCYWSWVSAI